MNWRTSRLDKEDLLSSNIAIDLNVDLVIVETSNLFNKYNNKIDTVAL